MNKIKEIVLAWAFKMNPSQEQKEVAEERLKTCMGCEYWRESAVGIEYCSKCGCSTRAKVFSPVGASACPLNKWTI